MKNNIFMVFLFFVVFFSLVVIPKNDCINLIGAVICSLIYMFALLNKWNEANKLERLFLIYGIIIAIFVFTFFAFHIVKDCLLY